jgi:MSHA biogenesis protein MshJ
MKDWWKLLAGRIDALSLRERALLFLSLLICGLVLGDQFWLAPAQQRQQQQVAKVKQQDAELLLLRTQLLANKTDAPAANAAQAVRLDMAALQSRIETVNREIDQLSRLGGQTDPLPKVLLHILKRYDGLTLERTATLASEATSLSQVGAAAPSAPLLRHGMEFTVSGSYGELMRYVQTLELELPALRWGTMKLSSGKPTPSLALQVFWLGVAP